MTDADAVVLVTAHPGVDHAVRRRRALFVDLRGATRQLRDQNIVRL